MKDNPVLYMVNFISKHEKDILYTDIFTPPQDIVFNNIYYIVDLINEYIQKEFLVEVNNSFPEYDIRLNLDY